MTIPANSHFTLLGHVGRGGRVGAEAIGGWAAGGGVLERGAAAVQARLLLLADDGRRRLLLANDQVLVEALLQLLDLGLVDVARLAAAEDARVICRVRRRLDGLGAGQEHEAAALRRRFAAARLGQLILLVHGRIVRFSVIMIIVSVIVGRSTASVRTALTVAVLAEASAVVVVSVVGIATVVSPVVIVTTPVVTISIAVSTVGAGLLEVFVILWFSVAVIVAGLVVAGLGRD